MADPFGPPGGEPKAHGPPACGSLSRSGLGTGELRCPWEQKPDPPSGFSSPQVAFCWEQPGLMVTAMTSSKARHQGAKPGSALCSQASVYSPTMGRPVSLGCCEGRARAVFRVMDSPWLDLGPTGSPPSLSLWTPCRVSPLALFLSCSLPSLHMRHICLALKSFSLSLSSLCHSLLGPKSWLSMTCCINLSRGQSSHPDRGHLKLCSPENSPGAFTKCRFLPHFRESDSISRG